MRTLISDCKGVIITRPKQNCTVLFVTGTGEGDENIGSETRCVEGVGGSRYFCTRLFTKLTVVNRYSAVGCERVTYRTVCYNNVIYLLHSLQNRFHLYNYYQKTLFKIINYLDHKY